MFQTTNQISYHVVMSARVVKNHLSFSQTYPPDIGTPVESPFCFTGKMIVHLVVFGNLCYFTGDEN